MVRSSFQICVNVVQLFPELSKFRDAQASRSLCDVLWWGLTHGVLSVVQSENDRHHAALRIRAHAPEAIWRPRADVVEAFERVLLGSAQKVVASDFSIPNPSLSAMLTQVTHNMGFRCSVSRIPLAVPLLLHALRRRAHHDLCVSRSSSLENELHIRVRRLDAVLGPDLSNGERDVN